MCDFFSGLIDRKDLSKLYLHDGRSHSETATACDLKPEQYREFEWPKDDDGKSLSVRTLPDDPYPEASYRTAILARFSSRPKLVRYWLEHLPKKIGSLDVRGCDLKGVTLPMEKP